MGSKKTILKAISIFEKKYSCKMLEITTAKHPVKFLHVSSQKEFSVNYSTIKGRISSNKYKDLFIAEIIEKIHNLCKKQGFIWIDNYVTARHNLHFKHIESGILHKQTWDTIKHSKKISLRNNKSYYTNKVKRKIVSLNMEPLTNGLYSDKRIIKFKCKKCNHIYTETCNAVLLKRSHCTKCEPNTKYNGFINSTIILRENPYQIYYLYFGKFIDNNFNTVYKVGLYKNSQTFNRFKYADFKNPVIFLTLELPIYQAYYLEQKLIFLYKDFAYKGDIFAGHNECFNSNLNYVNFIKKTMTLLEEIQDRKPDELLESLGADNQQPSLSGNTFEGSTTNSRVLANKVEDSNADTSVGHPLRDDDIV